MQPVLQVLGPRLAVSSNTGSSFIPGTSPNGNRARKISPRRIHRLSVFQRVNILVRVRELRRPFPGYTMSSAASSFVLVRQQDDQADLSGR